MITMTNPTTNFPAMQGKVGNRLATYATQVPPHSIEGLLGHDPRSRFWKKLPGDLEAIYSKVQRATSPQRLRGIMDYIKVRFRENSLLIGAFPAISVAVQNEVRFRPIDPVTHPGVGNIEIDMSSRNSRIVVDGVGRLSAVLELLELSYSADISDKDRAFLKKLLEGFSIPVIIYAPHPGAEPLTRDEMGQLFFDFNFKVTAVPPRIAIALDKSDPYIMVTNGLAKASRAIALNGGMEERAASLGKKSTAIVVQQVLLRFVRGAMEGSAFQESNKVELTNPNLTHANAGDTVDALTGFIDAFAEAMGSKFTADRKSLHLSSPGWQSLGVIYNDLVHQLNVPDPLQTARALARIDWGRSGPLWADLMVTKVAEDGSQELVLNSAGASIKREMVKRIRAELGINQLLSEKINEGPDEERANEAEHVGESV